MTAFVSTDISITNGSTTVIVNDNVDFSQVSTSSVLFIDNNSPVIVDAGTAPDTPTSGASQLTLRSAWADATVTNGEALLLVGMNALVDAITKANDSGTILANMTAAQADLYSTTNAAYPIQVSSSQSVNVPTWPYLVDQFSNGNFTTLTSNGQLDVGTYINFPNATGTGAAGERWIGTDGADNAFYNVATGNSHLFGVNNGNVLTLDASGATFAGDASVDGLITTAAGTGRSLIKSPLGLVTVGAEFSNSNTIIGYAVEPSTTTSNTFVSAFAPSLARSAIQLGNGGFSFWGGADQAVAVGSNVSMTEHFNINGDSGNVGIGTSSPSTKLAVSNNNAETLEFGPGYLTGKNVIQSFDRTGLVAVGTDYYALDHRFYSDAVLTLALDNSQNATFAGLLNAQELRPNPAAGDSNVRFQINSVEKGKIAANSTGDVYIETNGSEAVRWNAAGDTTFSGRLIVDTDPGSTVKFGVTGDGTTNTTYAAYFQNSSLVPTHWFNDQGDVYHLGNVGIGIAPNGTIGTYMYSNSTSDADVALIHQDNAASTNRALRIVNDGSGLGLYVESGASQFNSNVGIGIAPTINAKCYIEGNATNDTMRLTQNTSSTVGQIGFFNSNGGVGSITTSGTSTAYNTSSDPRLKDFLLIQEVLLERGFSDYDSMINADFDNLYNTSKWFRFKGEDSVTHGFDAHACIDAGLDMGTEGTGPRDLAIGDVYETEEIPEVTKPVIEKVQVTVSKTRPTKEIKIIDGKPVQVIGTEPYEEPVFEDVAVVDEDGNPVTVLVESGEFEDVIIGQDRDGNDIFEVQPIMVEQTVTYPMPVMETITKTVVTQEAQTIEKKVTSAGVDQAKAVPILLAKLKQQDDKLAMQDNLIQDLLTRITALEA